MKIALSKQSNRLVDEKWHFYDPEMIMLVKD